MDTDRPIVVAGAGAIGCLVGGMLAAGGRRVALLARPRVKTEIERFGLRLTDFDGSEKKLSAGRLALSEDPAIFHSAGIVLVTVKSADTADVADQIAQHAPGGQGPAAANAATDPRRCMSSRRPTGEVR